MVDRPPLQRPWDATRSAMLADRRAARRRALRRRRLVAAAVAVGLVVALVVVARAAGGFSGVPAASGTSIPAGQGPPGSSDVRPGTGGPTGSSTAPGQRSTVTTSPTVTVPQPPYPVGSIHLQLTDGTRSLPTVVRYPAAASGVGAAPLRAAGPYPLIVFSQGFDISPESYADLLAAWASQGYVVADPFYPLTTPGDAGGVVRADIVHHPADLDAVINALVAAGAEPASAGPLGGLIDGTRVGLAGHSDGGDVVDALVANSCCHGPPVKAVAILSGAEYTVFGGSYRGPSVPTLVVQGDRDTINPPGCSQQIYDGATGTRYYLDLLGAGHHTPYLDPAALAPYHDVDAAEAPAYRSVVDRVTEVFWSHYLGGHGTAAGMAAAGNVAGVATLTAGTAVPVTGSCPGAPATG